MTEQPDMPKLDATASIRFPAALAEAAKRAAARDGFASASEWIRAMVVQEIRRRDADSPVAAALDRPAPLILPADEFAALRTVAGALADALEGMQEMISYVPGYFIVKHGLGAYIERAEAAVAASAGSGTDDTGGVPLAAEAGTEPRPGPVPGEGQDGSGGGAGIALIRAERLRQVAVEGYTPEHDAGHGSGVLAEAAAAYVMYTIGWPSTARDVWPFGDGFKPGPKPLDSLVKAGALIAAELDRIVAEEARRG